ncbi:MAG: RNA polymerase sigma factor [Solirubrobacteraceae bacterium]
MAAGAVREHWSDERLLAAIAACDGDAFSVFYRRHLPRTVGYLLAETRDRELAADLAAEVFASVLLSARRYRPQRDTAGPWVLGIARNVLGASRRRRRVEDRARRRLGLEPIELDDYDLERTAALAGERGGVLALVEGLPKDERDAVTARVIDERAYSEIAAGMRCSELVVRKRVSRGLGRLRAQVKRGDG